MATYKIFMDASGDVDLALIQSGEIELLSMQYDLGEELAVCSGADSQDELKGFYKKLRGGIMPKTSQITPFIYEEIFTPYLEKGVSILYLCLSSGLSATYESACTAAQNLKERFPNVDFVPVDSRSATGGMGIMAEKLIQNKNAGLSILDNKAKFESERKNVTMRAFVQDLMHLKRGGRIGAAAAAFGKMLNIKPILRITEEGKLEVFDKQRGEKKAIIKLLDEYLQSGNLACDTPVYVCDSDNPDLAAYMESKIKEVNPNVIVKRKTLSPIIGTHLGPGSVILCFEQK